MQFLDLLSMPFGAASQAQTCLKGQQWFRADTWLAFTRKGL